MLGDWREVGKQGYHARRALSQLRSSFPLPLVNKESGLSLAILGKARDDEPMRIARKRSSEDSFSYWGRSVMKLAIAAVLAIIVASTLGLASSRQEATSPAPKVQQSGYETEIVKVNEAFRAAFDGGDAKALAATFTADAELADDAGKMVHGREAIAAHFASGFETSPKATIKIETESIRSLAPGLAIEEGTSTVTSASGIAEEPSRYEAIYMKVDGRWFQARVREYQRLEISPHEHLKPLEWMLGEWVDESPHGLVHSSCQWSEDGNFLLRDLHVLIQGKKAMTITQRIGWNPVSSEIKGWVFDSGGGHGEQTWIPSGENGWMVKTDATTPDGKRATSTNMLTRTGKDTASWVSTDRTLGGQVLESIEEITLVRRPAPPKRP
jgi:uncharacterized protein (TIGR02246 family)